MSFLRSTLMSQCAMKTYIFTMVSKNLYYIGKRKRVYTAAYDDDDDDHHHHHHHHVEKVKIKESKKLDKLAREFKKKKKKKVEKHGGDSNINHSWNALKNPKKLGNETGKLKIKEFKMCRLYDSIVKISTWVLRWPTNTIYWCEKLRKWYTYVMSAFSWSGVYNSFKYPVRWQKLLGSARSGSTALSYQNCYHP